MRRMALLSAVCGALLASSASVEAQSTTVRTLGFEGNCAGTPFDAGDFSFFGYMPIASSLYAPCGVQSIITTASSGGSPQIHNPPFNDIDGMDGNNALAGGTAAFLATGPLEFVFSPPVNEVSLRVLDQALADALTIRALDVDGNVLNTATPPVDANEISSYSFTTPTTGTIRPISRLQVEYVPGFLDTWYVDRLRFNAWRCGDGELEFGEACDDGNTRQCDGCDNSCQVTQTGCRAGSVCIANGVSAPDSFGCAVCDTSLPVPVGGDLTPTPKAAAAACNDGLYCRENEACNGAGLCVGTARNCADLASCTTDSCNEATDTCDHVLTAGGCAIGASCLNAGALNPLNPCEVCDPSRSTTAYSPASALTTCGNPSCSAGQLTPAALCNGAGTCTPGTTAACPGAAACQDPFSCTGACTRDDQCVLGSYCRSGICIPKDGPGDPCTLDGQCTTNFCTDGVCCDKSCDGTCESCALPSSVGTCRPYARETDPELECGETRFCSGGRTCVIDERPNGETCDRDELCASGNCVDGVCCGSRCDGTCEACNLPLQLGICSPYAAGTDPEVECNVGQFCSGQRGCTIDTRPDGEECTDDATCASGHCADGVCCNQACDRSCESCRLSGSIGVCTPHEVGTDPERDCLDTEMCNAPGVCVPIPPRDNGDSCERDAVCASGHCADGLCCDSPCDGVCVSCATPGSEGTCTAFPAGTDPLDECAGEAVCDGIDRCLRFETRGNGFCAVSPVLPARSNTLIWLSLSGLAGLVLRRRYRVRS